MHYKLYKVYPEALQILYTTLFPLIGQVFLCGAREKKKKEIKKIAA